MANVGGFRPSALAACSWVSSVIVLRRWWSGGFQPLNSLDQICEI